MRYDGVDFSEWQSPDPQWGQMNSHSFVCTRLCDGAHYDPTFADNWRAMQSLPAQWKGFYVLPDPRIGWQTQLDYVKSFYDRAGVQWGQGHLVSIDDEPTPSHGQLTGDEMRAFRSGLLSHFGRQEELHYVGAYNGNNGFCLDEGWPWWLPWPTSNGGRPSWCYNIAAWQWGVASAGEVPGFPNSNVDVNQIEIASQMDLCSGGSGGPGGSADLDAIEHQWLEAIHRSTNASATGWKWPDGTPITTLPEFIHSRASMQDASYGSPILSSVGTIQAQNRHLDEELDHTDVHVDLIAQDVKALLSGSGGGGGGGGVIDYVKLAKAIVDELVNRINPADVEAMTSTMEQPSATGMNANHYAMEQP